ncbi:hypothetical protein GGF46_002726 [Coemansia sp. RSA 552]|nr:hypothetical protein GGF46_002726 [Coemansia sp. RSA 552]
MSAACLPDDVLRLILGAVQLDPTLVHRLVAPAAVCAHWRHICLPLLYRTVVIRAKEASVTSNVGLFQQNGLVGLARQMDIHLHTAEGAAPSYIQQVLETSGLLESKWLRVETLKVGHQTIATADSVSFGREQTDEVNHALSSVLPALRDISLSDLTCRYGHSRIWLLPLINERLGRPQGLHSLRIFADMRPLLPHPGPICLSRLHIDGVNFPRALAPSLLQLQAESLVELTLSSVEESHVWDFFAAPTELAFTRLEYLQLVFFWKSQVLWFPSDSSSSSSSSSSSDSDVSEDSDSERRQPLGYLESSRYGTPRFPVLRKLAIRRFPDDLQRFLALFASSTTLQSLVVAGLQQELPETLEFSRLSHLRSLDLRYVGTMYTESQGYLSRALARAFATAPPDLQQLSLRAGIEGGRHSGFEIPEHMAFSAHLQRLSLSVDIGADAIVRLLLQLPALVDLTAADMDVEAILSVAMLLQRLRDASGEDMGPASLSLRRLMLPSLKSTDRVLGDPYALNVQAPPRKEILTWYYGALFSLVCRLPALATLYTADSVAGNVRMAARALVQSGVAAPLTAHLGPLRILPWAAQ